MLKKVYFLLILSIFTLSLNAAVVKKVKGRRIIFTLKGLDDLEKGDYVIIETSGKDSEAKVIKKNKKLALAKITKGRKRIRIGDKVYLAEEEDDEEFDDDYNEPVQKAQTPPKSKLPSNRFFIEPSFYAGPEH